MFSTSRQFGLALILFMTWLAAALGAQMWLHARTERLHEETTRQRRDQVQQALRLMGDLPATWDEARCQNLGLLLNGTVTLLEAGDPLPAPTMGMLRVEQALPGEHGARLLVTFSPGRESVLASLHWKVLAGTGLLALLLVIAILLLPFLRRPGDERREDDRLARAEAEINALAHLARVSVERTEALASESGARRRAEENLELSRTLLDHSVEERVKLGRDLHDNLCQTLYAVSLNLEGTRKRLRQQPAEAEQSLSTCIAELRAANREVRAHIAGLSPDAVRCQSFVEALQGLLASFENLTGTQFEQRVDAGTAALLTPTQATEALHILREAVSNAVRHGGARRVSVRGQAGVNEVVLAVHDDGGGFDPVRAAGQGHGLENMRARTAALGGSLRVVSRPGAGTHVALILPVLAP